ncbi:MAG: TonB family protein, partial [Acidobacteria bacterium]|nr:TonB family protein [Acidobacteriota bacterium]
AMARVDDTRAVPTEVSTTPNTHLAIPDDGRYKSAAFDSNPVTDSGGSGRGNSGGSPGNDRGIATPPAAPAANEDPTPPPIKAPEPKRVQTKGVLNSTAVSLPVPAYPAPARAVRAQGKVTVEVTLDETGRVISAAAVDGSPLLRAAAVDAARRARFTPTYLSGIPVKVTGVIVYNFNLG